MTIADSYRAMSEDIRRAAEAVEVEDVRRAYLELADLWLARSTHVDNVPSVASVISESIKPSHSN